MIYTSMENEKIKEMLKLKDKKYRKTSGLFLVEGEHLVNEAFLAGYLKKIIKLETNNIDYDVETMIVSEKVLKNLSFLQTPTIIGVCSQKNDRIKGNHLLLLDDIQDPGNLGTIIRSAVAFNVDTIVLSENTVDLYNEKVIRATQGLIFKINIVTGDLSEIVSKLKTENYKIYATDVNGGKSLKNVERCEKFAIIMGNEGSGVKPSLLDASSEHLYISMNKNCESLNVGVATSIVLYELDK